MNLEEVEKTYHRIPSERRKQVSFDSDDKNKKFNVYEKVKSFVPIIDWLPNYKWRNDFQYDLVAGLTVGVMVVPQGMAYATLASLPPVYGLYASFFAPLIYMFFGTSRHISVGIFAVASMMVATVRLRLAPDPIIETRQFPNGSIVEQVIPVRGEIDFGFDVVPTELLSSLTLAVGIAQMIMAAFRLSFMTTYMSDQLLSGFTTGAGVHVLLSQLNKVFGVKMPRHSGIGMLILMTRDIILELPNTNFVTLGISAISLAYLIGGCLFLNPWFKEKYNVPLPLELFLVTVTTLCSKLFDFKHNMHVSIVDHIPRGLPEPALPKPVFLPYLVVDAISIAIICYMFVVSMGMLFAKKHGYKTDPSQELVALGFMNIIGSFFPVYPSGASLSRSSVCEMNGVRTQLVNFFVCGLLLVVILWVGPFLEPLPMCVLASIVITGLISLFKQALVLPRLWKVSKWDFTIWVVSCVVTVVTDPTKGLFISFLFVVVTVILREQWPQITSKTVVDDNTLALESAVYEEGDNKLQNVQIISFQAPLHFANVEKFAKMVEAITGSKTTEARIQPRPKLNNGEDLLLLTNGTRSLVFDFSSVAYVDMMGLDAIRAAYVDGSNKNFRVYLTNISECVLDAFERFQMFSTIPKTNVFLTVQDALSFIRKSNAV